MLVADDGAAKDIPVPIEAGAEDFVRFRGSGPVRRDRNREMR